ncbi:MAG: hypothetical protein QUS08_02110 [Methanothrix sp.]|nr:hypothetical protein [Methanothrix sp.]
MIIMADYIFVPLVFGPYSAAGLLASFIPLVAWNLYGDPLIHPSLHRADLRVLRLHRTEPGSMALDLGSWEEEGRPRAR